jgi:hypothetical protein
LPYCLEVAFAIKHLVKFFDKFSHAAA